MADGCEIIIFIAERLFVMVKLYISEIKEKSP